MNKVFTKFSVVVLAMIMTFSMSVSAFAEECEDTSTSYAVTSLGNEEVTRSDTTVSSLLFINTSNSNGIGKSGSKSLTLGSHPTLFGYIAMPMSSSGTVTLTIKKNLYSVSYTLVADGQYHEISISSTDLWAATYTASFSSTVSLRSISITFAQRS